MHAVEFYLKKYRKQPEIPPPSRGRVVCSLYNANGDFVAEVSDVAYSTEYSLFRGNYARGSFTVREGTDIPNARNFHGQIYITNNNHVTILTNLRLTQHVGINLIRGERTYGFTAEA